MSSNDKFISFYIVCRGQRPKFIFRFLLFKKTRFNLFDKYHMIISSTFPQLHNLPLSIFHTYIHCHESDWSRRKILLLTRNYSPRQRIPMKLGTYPIFGMLSPKIIVGRTGSKGVGHHLATAAKYDTHTHTHTHTHLKFTYSPRRIAFRLNSSSEMEATLNFTNSDPFSSSSIREFTLIHFRIHYDTL